MAEAPLKTKQVINFLPIKSIKIGESPHLITWAPNIQTKGFPFFLAWMIFSISRLKSEAFRILDSEFKKVDKLFLADRTLAKFLTSTLLFLELIETVLIFFKSISGKLILFLYFPQTVSF